MEQSRLPERAWNLMMQEFFGSNQSWIITPQKLFLWDSKGIYIDYHYPNPVQYHYIGGDNLLGKRITAVLPKPMAKSVLTSVFQTLDLQQPLVEHYELTMQQQLFRVVVRFLPFEDKISGIVNDYPSQSKEETIPD